MSAKASVSKITVTVGKHTLELTLEEARALKKVLTDTLEPKVEFPVRDRIERIIEREVPARPMWAERNLPSIPGRWDVICRAGDSTARPVVLVE